MLKLVRIEKSENIDDGFHDKDKPMNLQPVDLKLMFGKMKMLYH